MQDGNKAGKQNQKGSRLKVILIVVVIIILLLAAGIWYYLREIEGKRKKGTHSYKRIIRWNSNQIYRILRRKGIVNAKVQSDRTFRKQLLNYGGWSIEEKERYLQILSMARSMMPNSAGSQFFIMHKDAPHLDGAYAAFGKIIEGMDVVNNYLPHPCLR